MGKTKHRKRKDRHKPTGMISVQEAEQQAEETEVRTFEAKTVSILEKLNCLEDREHACAGLAHLVLDRDAVNALMKHEVVRRVAPLMLDEDKSVQETAAGVLRNLTISGVPNICKMAIDQDIMTSLIFYIKKFSETLKSSPECSELIKQQASVHEQVMHLLLNLCENASGTLKIANEESLVPILTSFLNPDLLPLKNVLASAQCLCIITEDNPAAGEALVNSKNSLAILENILTIDGHEEFILLKVLVAGTLFNIHSSLPAQNTVEMFQAIAKVLSKVLDYDILQCLEQLKRQIKPEQVSPPQNGLLKDGSFATGNNSSVIDQQIHKFRQLLEAQKSALEVLTNMCCTDDSGDQDWNGHSGDDNSSSDDVEDDGVEHEDMDLEMDSSNLSNEIIAAVVTHELPKKVLQKCSFVRHGDCDVIRSTQSDVSCIKLIETIQTRALVCLNNMVSTIDVDQLGGPGTITHLWMKIMEIAFQNNGFPSGFARSDDEFVEAASSALRSVLEKLACSGSQGVTAEQANLLCHLSTVVILEPARVNLMNVLGIVGKMMIASLADVVGPLQCIATVLRDVVVSGESLWVIAEALDAIFDVFADSPAADIAASNVGLLAHLEKVVPVLKTRVKKERHTLGDRIPIVNTARTNLVRFLKYKSQTN